MSIETKLSAARTKLILDKPFLDGLEVLNICDTTRLSKRIQIAHLDVAQPDYILIVLQRGTKVYLSRRDVQIKLLKLDEILAKADRMRQQIISIDMTVDKNFPTEIR